MIVMVIKNVMMLMFGRAPYGALLWTHLPAGNLAPHIIISLWHGDDEDDDDYSNREIMTLSLWHDNDDDDDDDE